MTPLNPDWEQYNNQYYSPLIPEAILKYRTDEVEKVLSWQKEHCFYEPAEVEIGSNRGRFLIGLAQARRSTRFLGIELKSSLCALSERQNKRRGLDNAFVINADANIALPILFRPGQLLGLYTLFPDPWWKKKHEKRRLVTAEFLNLLHVLMKDKACYVLKTDVEEYKERVIECLEAHPHFEIVPIEKAPYFDTWAHTTRERHCIADGLPVYTACAVHHA